MVEKTYNIMFGDRGMLVFEKSDAAVLCYNKNNRPTKNELFSEMYVDFIFIDLP